MSTFTVEGDVCLLKIGINKFSIIIKFDIAQFPVPEIVIRELRFFFLLLTGGCGAKTKQEKSCVNKSFHYCNNFGSPQPLRRIL